MSEYKITADEKLDDELTSAAKEKGVSVEQLILQILNKYLISPHILDQEAMAKGYEEMGQINLELSK